MLDKLAAHFEERLEKGLKCYDIPLYMHEAIREYVNHHEQPGHFLQAVIKNNLREAVSRADDRNSYALKGWVGLMYNYCPSPCWGSEMAYKEWIKKDDNKNRINRQK